MIIERGDFEMISYKKIQHYTNFIIIQIFFMYNFYELRMSIYFSFASCFKGCNISCWAPSKFKQMGFEKRTQTL